MEDIKYLQGGREMLYNDVLYRNFAKKICNKCNFDYNKLDSMSYNDESAIFSRYPKDYVAPKKLMLSLDDSVKLIPVLEVYPDGTYKVYDEEYLKK